MAKFFLTVLGIVWLISSLAHGEAIARSEVEVKQSRIDNLEYEVKVLRREVDRINKEFNFKPDAEKGDGFKIR